MLNNDIFYKIDDFNMGYFKIWFLGKNMFFKNVFFF